MTEKRYVKENFFDEYAIKKEDTIIAIVDSGTNARKICNELNALYEENEELRIDNDIKFWKHECLREANTNSILAFELGKAINEGYVVSEKFKQMMEEWEKETEKMKEKHQRLFE